MSRFLVSVGNTHICFPRVSGDEPPETWGAFDRA